MTNATRTSSLVLVVLAALTLASAGCSVIVSGKLDDKPSGRGNDDAGPPIGCTDNAQCNDSNLCNGVETCNTATHTCVPGTAMPNPTADGTYTECDSNRDSVPDGFCIGATCTPKAMSRCGDRIKDTSMGHNEQCDDGNVVEDDGCKNDCTFTCTRLMEARDCPVGPCLRNSCDASTHTCRPVAVDTGGACIGMAGRCQSDGSCMLF